MTQLKCPFTGITINDGGVKINHQTVTYEVETGEFSHTYTVPKTAIRVGWNEDKWFRRNKHLIVYAMYNGLSLFDESETIDIPLVRQRLAASVIPHTPKRKLDSLITYIADQLSSPGNSYYLEFRSGAKINTEFQEVLRQTYLLDRDEFMFYVKSLHSAGYVTASHETSDSIAVTLTYNGLNYLASLEDAGAESKNCFVAMSFDKSRKDSRAAIVQALVDCGYDAVIIDTRDIDSDKTINDQIIADIRRCNTN